MPATVTVATMTIRACRRHVVETSPFHDGTEHDGLGDPRALTTVATNDTTLPREEQEAIATLLAMVQAPLPQGDTAT